MAGLTSPSDAATTYLGEANKNFGTGAATAGKNINFQDIGRALGGIGSVIGAFGSSGSSGGADGYKKAIEELEESVRKSTDELDRRATEYETKILDLQKLNDTFTGNTTSDAVSAYKQYFEDISRGLTTQYTDVLRNERPDLSDYTSKLGGTINNAREEFGLLNSPAMDAYQKVISTDPRKIFPNALDFSPEVGYNQKNPLITYMDDPDAVSMMNFGRPQVNEYTRAMADGAGPGQSLMNYNV
tara:strand:+ start:2350 stop:3078 length:729 start_codon:yes stop_codon:yes gene_type:complete